MRAPRAHFVALLIASLIFGVVACVASCTGGSLSSPVPPCHQHQAPGHATAAACTQDFLLPDAPPSPLLYFATIGLAAPSVENSHWFAVVDLFTSPDFSPPRSPSVLRL